MQTVKQNWEEYRRACYGSAALGPVQEREVKQAFYSGAFAMVGLLGVLTPLPEAEAVQKLEGLYKEVENEITNVLLRRQKRDN